MTRHILIKGRECLNSSIATNWASKHPKDVEVIYFDEIPDVAAIYGVVRLPTLLKIGKHGLIEKVDGFNKRKYNEVIGGIEHV